jgi:hypothetical protein
MGDSQIFARFIIGKDKRLYAAIHDNKMREARRDMSKLAAKVITGKNGHQRKVYVKIALTADKDGKLEKKEETVKGDVKKTLMVILPWP